MVGRLLFLEALPSRILRHIQGPALAMSGILHKVLGLQVGFPGSQLDKRVSNLAVEGWCLQHGP